MRLLILLFSSFLCSVSFAGSRDTVSIYFDLGIPTLNSKATATIDTLFYNDRLYTGASVLIIGYADFLGTETANKGLSYARAANVQRQLQQFGIDTGHIKLCIGRGAIKRKVHTPDGYPTDRKVDIVILKTPVNVSNPSASVSHLPAVHKGYAITDLANYSPGETMLLRNIYFPAQSHDIKASLRELDKLYNVLYTHPRLRIQVEGHVCCITGYTDAYDMDTHENMLSINRAKAIYDYLVNRGINADRLSYAGFGKQRPVVAIEHSEEDAAKNRRVEIRILEK
ncbi:MAG: OmpA family protein [Taibaiella sp.]|nr:OmpA family protein [Taibaiella sp.]